MFEKEAEEYRERNIGTISLPTHEAYARGLEEGFQDGAELGLRRANEWHFVKDELPEEDVYVLLWCKNDTFPVVACRHTFTSWGRTDWEWDCKWGSGYEIKQNDPRVIAWKEIVPPKEVE